MKTKTIINFIYIITFGGLVVSSGCKDTGTEIIAFPSSNVSYSVNVQPVLNLYCARGGCHDDQTRAGNVSLTSWGNIVNYIIVFPGSPQTSKLIWVITGQSATPMPPVGWPSLTKEYISGITTWVKEGAKNN